jgi:hypothetical protein
MLSGHSAVTSAVGSDLDTYDDALDNCSMDLMASRHDEPAKSLVVMAVSTFVETTISLVLISQA